MTLLYLVPSLSCLIYRVKARGLKRYVAHHLPISPLTQQLGLCLPYCFSVLSALIQLTYAVACKSDVSLL